jgi:hypothetical protein
MFKEIIGNIQSYLSKYQVTPSEKPKAASNNDDVEKALHGMEKWFFLKTRHKAKPHITPNEYVPIDSPIIDDLGFKHTPDDLPIFERLETIEPIPPLEEKLGGIEEIESKSTEEVFDDARSRWLLEKRNLKLAKKEEDKRLKEDYATRYKNFKQQIGLTIGLG